MQNKCKHPILRTLTAALLLAFLSFTVLWASDLLISHVSPREYTPGVPDSPANMRALMVNTSDGDFPGNANLSAKEQRERLDELLRFTKEYGFNTLYYEAVSDAQAYYPSKLLPAAVVWTGKKDAFAFFDPLDYLTNEAKAHDIRVYAVVKPFALSDETAATGEFSNTHSDLIIDGKYLDPANQQIQTLMADLVKELTHTYDLAGVIYSGLDAPAYNSVADYSQHVQNILKQSKSALRDSSVQTIGLITNTTDTGENSFMDTALTGNHVAFIAATFSADPVTETETLIAQLASVQALAKKHNVKYYPLCFESDESITNHAAENVMYLSKDYGAKGIAIGSYGSLHTDSGLAAASLAASFTQKIPDDMPDYTFDEKFSVTRPTAGITVLPSTQTYFVTGTSDPSIPVYFENTEIKRITNKGLWGVLVNLAYGENTYRFSQGNEEQTVTIMRPQSSSSTINTIVKSSAYPSYQELVLDGTQLRLSCTAPAGGTVSATISGLSVPLSPVKQASAGTPVAYQGTLDISSLAHAGQVRAVGQVSYHLSYNAVNSTQQSAGTVFVAGAGAVPVAQMKTFASTINQNPADDGNYRTILRDGCVDVITQNTGGYYKLASGGYILKGGLDILEGAADPVNQVKNIALQQTEKGEKLVINGTVRPAYVGQLEDGVFKITLYHQSGWNNMNPSLLQSELCDTIEVTENEDTSVTLTFHLRKDVRLLGWDVIFEGNDMSIYLKKMPQLQSSATPLKSLVIVLDPGHGGDDPGALGVPGQKGPSESILNLANSYILRSRLEALGATVHLAANNGNTTLNERLEFAQKYDADLFISSHHNSLAESSDANSAAGIEVYFWNEQSKQFADQIAANLSQQTNRRLRFTQQSWYRVTMMMACPAVLVESGFVCNPAEYENMANDYAMYRYGNAVADAVLQYFS